jgi:predicted nucleic acid-binding protein
VFLAWLNAEDAIHGAAVMDGIREMVRDIDANRANVVTSVMTKTEVFHKLKTQWAKDEYTKFCQRPNVAIVNQDERVADRSSEIREHYTKKGITLDAGDCVHLATATLYGADTFYTLDGAGQHPKPNDLLPLNSNVAGHQLSIEKPHAKQGSLFSGVPNQAVSSAIKPDAKLKLAASNPHKTPPKKKRSSAR